MCNSVQYALHMRELIAEIRAEIAKRKAARKTVSKTGPSPVKPALVALSTLSAK